jgi:cell division protein FtsN
MSSRRRAAEVVRFVAVAVVVAVVVVVVVVVTAIVLVERAPTLPAIYA